ncbi:Uncharacterised protein [Mycobacterium tuberculosis]|uniref:Uncharacterized protein n=1 Tax=Mycobacterium tuberculosis TaxID=1773 RepID=A0A655FZH4_MYCTX|nr:Uncharacterised protein [Mycobacterium tuberculosis]CKP65739.1 Uncharacterised protein [Mycobacterium tuberculosis]CKT14896.1 Uncharacterised protein [Mycobacterium tuberculosis]CKU18800.1 Uncharacterised protein [Mycobacterium tuberculosis]CNW72295.1 Uncharacterised protein [Mycobacterium tuberculosis]
MYFDESALKAAMLGGSALMYRMLAIRSLVVVTV